MRVKCYSDRCDKMMVTVKTDDAMIVVIISSGDHKLIVIIMSLQ